MATVMGWLVAPSFLHPVRRPLTPGLIREADASFAHSRAQREDFNVTAPDGADGIKTGDTVLNGQGLIGTVTAVNAQTIPGPSSPRRR